MTIWHVAWAMRFLPRRAVAQSDNLKFASGQKLRAARIVLEASGCLNR